MPRKMITYTLFIILLVLLPLGSCGPKSQAGRTQAEQEKKIEQRRQEGDRIMREARQRHMNAQSPEVRQRMKETRRKSDRLNNRRREPFYMRWYRTLTGWW